MKKRNHLVASALLILALPTIGCSFFAQPSTETVVTDYLTAVFDGSRSEAYRHVCASDKAAKSLDQYISEQSTDTHTAMSKIVLDNTSFKVDAITESGDTAVATVQLIMPDMRVLFRESFKAAQRGGDEDLGAILLAKYGDGNFPTMSKTQKLRLVRESGAWKVSLGWVKSSEGVL